jgi:A/G-specific adenine glycosylase
MPKRSAVTYPSSDDNGADDDFTYISDDSEAYEPAPKKAKRSGKGALSTTKATGSVRKTKPKLLSNGDKDLVSVKHGPTAPHSHTRHVIDAGTAEGAAKALLEWYAGVHESRGMPWRKPFNPEWTNAERGQRAYEVYASVVTTSL